MHMDFVCFLKKSKNGTCRGGKIKFYEQGTGLCQFGGSAIDMVALRDLLDLLSAFKLFGSCSNLVYRDIAMFVETIWACATNCRVASMLSRMTPLARIASCNPEV